jgi:hypothetical protein
MLKDPQMQTNCGSRRLEIAAADAELREVRLERALAQPIGGQTSVEPGASSSRGRTGRRPLEQRAPLPRVRGKQRCPLELGPGLVEPAQLLEQVAADAGQ